jgi:hypothetical protein
MFVTKISEPDSRSQENEIVSLVAFAARLRILIPVLFSLFDFQGARISCLVSHNTLVCSILYSV